MIFHKPCQSSDRHTYLYADDNSNFYQHKDVAEIENVLNKESAHVCEWFADNKLSLHFGEDKTKCILFSKKKNLLGLNITYKNNRIKQFNIVEYLGCYLDANLSGESMAMKSLKKINAKLQLLYRQNEFRNPKLRRLLCNSLIQPHFGQACVSWYLLVSKKIRKKIQVTQNKCIRFCLKLNSRHHIGAKEFQEINWLPTKERVEQRVATNVLKYSKWISPFYVNELFVPSRNIYKTRSHVALEVIPLRKSNLSQKSIPFMGQSIWNKLSNDLKILDTATSYTHNYKKLVLKKLE